MEERRTAGYSGTPLAKKLAIREASHILLLGAPDGYERFLEPLPDGVKFERRLDRTIALVHVFVTRREDLEAQLGICRKKLNPDVALWVSWPKKASKVPTTVTEDVIRDVALPLGFVDVKVCAVSEIWSALKLVVRKEHR